MHKKILISYAINQITDGIYSQSSLIRLRKYMIYVQIRALDNVKPLFPVNEHQVFWKWLIVSINLAQMMYEQSHAWNYSDVIMGAMTSQFTGVMIVLLNYLFRRRWKKTSLAFVRGIHRSQWIPRRKASNAGNFSIDDVIMGKKHCRLSVISRYQGL